MKIRHLLFCLLVLLISCRPASNQTVDTLSPTAVPSPTIQPTVMPARPTVFYLSKDESGQVQQLYTLAANNAPVKITSSEKDVVGFDINLEGEIAFNTADKMYLINKDGETESIYDCTISSCLDLLWNSNNQLGFSYDENLLWLNPKTGETEFMFDQEKVFGSNVELSPDGQWISYTDGVTYTLKLVNSTTEEMLSFKNGALYNVSWHPSGTNFIISDVAFEKNRIIVYIMLYDFLTQTSVNLTNISTNIADEQPVYSPEGNRIVFKRSILSGKKESVQQIWIVDQTGQNASALLDDLAYSYDRPVWFDETHVIAERISSEESSVGELIMVDITDGSIETLVKEGSSPKVFLKN